MFESKSDASWLIITWWRGWRRTERIDLSASDTRSFDLKTPEAREDVWAWNVMVPLHVLTTSKGNDQVKGQGLTPCSQRLYQREYRRSDILSALSISLRFQKQQPPFSFGADHDWWNPAKRGRNGSQFSRCYRLAELHLISDGFDLWSAG